MNYRFYETKVLYILISILICIQVGTFSLQVLNNRKVATETINEELKVGEKVLLQLLKYRNAQLLQTAEILTKDYAFLEAFSIARHDKSTIESVLQNHMARANASVLILSDLNNQVIAQTPNDSLILKDAQNTQDNRDAAKSVMHFSTLQLQNSQNNQPTLYHATVSALKSPNHIANLTVGYEINDEFVNSLHKMTNMELIFISKQKAGLVVHASSLKNISRSDLLLLAQRLADKKVQHIDISNKPYQMLPVVLSGDHGDSVCLMIAKPLEKAMQPYYRTEVMQFILLIASLLMSVMAIYVVTRKFVLPLSEQAHTDSLTGLGNRRTFNLILRQSFQLLRKTDTPFVLLMLDLNKFKQINDTLGHDMGDFVLKTVADRIKRSARSSDSIIRLGGDEFAVIIENCREAPALTIADEISQSIAQPMERYPHHFSVQASIGIALARKNDSLDAIVKRADEAMYISKTLNYQYFLKD